MPVAVPVGEGVVWVMPILAADGAASVIALHGDFDSSCRLLCTIGWLEVVPLVTLALVGRVASEASRVGVFRFETPTPDPSSQGGGERRERVRVIWRMFPK